MLPGAIRRRQYCRRNAGLIDLDPSVPVDRIFGESMPDEVFEAYTDSNSDEHGPTFFEVTACPLAMVDPDSPMFDQGVLVDIFTVSRGVAAGVPASWHPANPSDCLAEGVVLLKSEIDAAANFKATKSERW